jgi:hypothetical protein
MVGERKNMARGIHLMMMMVVVVVTASTRAET